ncbi:MAG: hypothetical protein KAR40_09675 [Candidatus Sabulitectum sp.]|nr:hypothetical protein [Candidatus Sabulitectum sp.]
MKRLFIALAVLLMTASVSYAQEFNNNFAEPNYSETSTVTKTAAYTVVSGDNHKIIRVTASSADITITLPRLSSISNGFGIKVLKTDATNYIVTVTRAGSDTIDGATSYAITKQNDFVILETTGGETDWHVRYADEIVSTNVATGVTTVGGTMAINGLDSLIYPNETTTATDTLTASQCGSTIFLNSATEYLTTLPTPSAGCYFKIVVKAAPASASYTIATNASANILIGGVNELEVDTSDDGPYSAVGDLITFVDGVAVVGDYVEMISDGTSWYLNGQTNADGGVTIGST